MARWKNPSLLENELERRRQYKGRLIERRADSGTNGVDPRDLDRALLEQVHPPAPLLDVIREKCLDCSGCQPSEIDRCTAIACSLWPYRFGTNPFSNRKGNAEALIRARGAKLGKSGFADEDAPGVDHRPDAPLPCNPVRKKRR
jgi:hypothetical protein